jgi:Fic family protein
MFDHIDKKHANWLSLQPLSARDEVRLWKKLRLEWNYHSNHIEGNTLTYGETELLLVHDQATGDHALRNYVEMKAHDLAIEHMRNLVTAERRLTEIDIRDLNRILLKEPFTKKAITSDGTPTQIEIVPGQYKTQPNNVRTADGGLFEFASPADVPIRMAALIDWLDQCQSTNDDHPIETIAKLHHEFVLIHPFGDGNGRTARILVNFALMRSGFPPIIIPTEQKDSYLAALRNADAGDLSTLNSFLARCVETALDRGIRAGNGEPLEEPDDLDKEIEVFKRRQDPSKREVEAKSSEGLRALYKSSLRPLFHELVEAFGAIDDLFTNVTIGSVGAKTQRGQSWAEAIEAGISRPLDRISHLGLNYVLKGYSGEAPSPFNIQFQFLAKFEEFRYTIDFGGKMESARLYSQLIPKSERQRIIRDALSNLFIDIKKQSGQDI